MENFIEFIVEMEFIGGGSGPPPPPPPPPPDEYTTLKTAAIAAAAANSAALWFLGTAADLVGNVYTDSAGTTQAVVGDPVGLMKDRNGNAFPATQSVSVAKPTIIQLPSGYCVLEFSVSGKWMTSPYSSAANADHTCIAASANVPDSAQNRTLLHITSSGQRFPQVRINPGTSVAPADAVYYYNSNSSLFVPTSPGSYSLALPPVISVKKNGSAATLYANGASVASATLAAGVEVMTETIIGNQENYGAVEPFDGQLALICVAQVAMSDADREAIERFGAFLTGVAYP